MVTNSAAVVSLDLDQLNGEYEKEIDGDIKERILFVRRVRFDGMEVPKESERELNITRWRA